MALPVKVCAVDGVWIRHAPGRSDLLGRSATTSDGRWQRARVTSALYLADSRETATAEWYRSLAERGFYPEDYLPFDHHRWHVSLKLADLSTHENLKAVGLSYPPPADAAGRRSKRSVSSCSPTGGTGYSLPARHARAR